MSDSREGPMMLYQVSVGDLTYFKKQQWSLTNHAFLLLAAILGVRQLLGSTAHGWEVITLAFFAAMVVASTLILLTKLQDSIVVRQHRLDAAREKLGFEFYEVWSAREKGREYIHAIWLLRGAIGLAGATVIWLLFRGGV